MYIDCIHPNNNLISSSSRLYDGIIGVRRFAHCPFLVLCLAQAQRKIDEEWRDDIGCVELLNNKARIGTILGH